MSKLLQPDVFRRATFWPTGARKRAHDAMVFGGLIVVSLTLTAMDKFDLPVTVAVRTNVQDGLSPVLRLATAVITPVVLTARDLSEWQSLASEHIRLREENDRLKGWQARAQALERQAVALNDLARVVEEPKLAFVTARIVTAASGPFVRGALLDAGRDHGVRPGYPVMSAQGLVGRVAAAGTRSARLLLLTDYNSRIPVIIGAEAVRAVMQGDNAPLPKIAYLQTGAIIKPGDEVFTSGVGGLYPRGLRVGTVVDTGDVLLIEPAARLERVDYISVLFFDSLAATLADDEQAAETRASLSKRLTPSWPTSAEGGLAR